MKHIVSALLITATTISLIGCSGGDGKPQNMDDETYNISKQALAIEERIRSGSLDGKEGQDQLQDLQDDLDERYYELDGSEQITNNRVSIALNGFCIDVNGGHDTTESYNQLKQLLGQ